ncbi:MAG: hypothetical protein ACRD6R_02895 [Candidatus Polarisedimenticolia bacterium]
MARFLVRIGGLLLVGACVYMAVWEGWMGGADNRLIVQLLAAGGACVGGGVILWALGRGAASLASRSCPRCGRRVARGRVYCEEHLRDAVNEFRDRERERRS